MRTTLFADLNELAAKTVGNLESGRVAISGGTTYSRLFPAWLAIRPNFRSTEFFPVDERIVPFEAPQSNWGMAYRQFLRHIGREVDKGNWPQSIEGYQSLLTSRFGAGVPEFDAIFLGVGTDGHTASLFPGEPYLDDLTSSLLQTHSPIPPIERITLAPAALSAARQLIVIVSGTGKEEVAQRILDKDKSLPAVRIMGEHRCPELFVDAALTKTSKR